MSIATCEKHGLRFDPETQAGCVLCRKEAVAASGVAPTVSTAAQRAERPSPAAVSPVPANGVLAPLAVAVGLWLVSALALYTIHQQIAVSIVAAQAAEEA